MSRLANHVVIGSGLSAIGSIRALLKAGYRPIVLDVGQTLPENKRKFTKKLALKNPVSWTKKERKELSSNKSIEDTSIGIPEKKLFGSSFFYGDNEAQSKFSYEGISPPFSFAKGGLAEGWGASTLPPSKDDVLDWPISYEEIIHYFKEVLNQLPFSAVQDDLNKEFPVLHDSPLSLRPAEFDKTLLAKLVKLSKKNPNLLCGQARLVVNASSSSQSGCKNCGECMSGCVFGAIYKPSDEIDALIKNDKIEYISQIFVTSLETNTEGLITVNYLNASGGKGLINAKRVYLGAGAINTSKIVLNSLQPELKNLNLQTRGGYVVPSFSFSKIKSRWPNTNTLPSIFIEQKNSFLKSWSHIQVSTTNELLIRKKLNLMSKSSFFSPLVNVLLSRVIVLFINYHSKHSGSYELALDKLNPKNKNPTLSSIYLAKKPNFLVRISSFFELLMLFLKTGNLLLLPFSILNSGTYHVGGSLPMRNSPKAQDETDIFGQLHNLKKVHIVDSSVFPSLPSTTIGLLSMSNAYRITEKTCFDD